MKSYCILVINCAVAVLFSTAHCLDSPDSVPVRISRRRSGDIYFLNQSNEMHRTCNVGENRTYLIADGCCISDQLLFNGN